MKPFGGLNGHEAQERLNNYIIEQKMNGVGFRKIAEGILTQFKTKVSHTIVSNYYKEVLNGATLDKVKGIATRSILEELPTEKGKEEITPTQIDQNRLNELLDKYKDVGGDIGAIYAYSIALCEANIKAHIEGECRLKIEYAKYLKDIRAVYGSKLEV